MTNIKQIIIIQKYIRRYLIRKNILIPSSYYQTKIWRKNRIWYINGRYNECEKYQINLIEYLLKFNKNNIYFINILDGNTSYNNINKFKFLIDKEKYKHVIDYIFVGSLYDFQKLYIIKIF